MNTQNVTASITTDDVRVGSFSLETLTTGMYENPLHCIREYVQNSYDAIRAARAGGLLTADEGLITIAITGSSSRPSLSVRDNGEGIASSEAISTLVSIGASRKRSNINAGFRGIGRLAGVAYCTTLRFTTTAQGETQATIVEFDCGRMRGFMRPGAEIMDVKEVIRLCVKTGQAAAKADDHFTEVEMIGLTGIGLEFAVIEKLVPYLRQVCPTDYSDRFTMATRIRTFSDSVGHPLGSIEVETKFKRERTQILKAYDDASPTSDDRKSSIITDIELINAPELGWHGWIGKSNFKGEITDDMVAGVRFRLKNIQIGGSDLIEELGAELTTGGTEGRLQRWAVGEIFITNPAVVPNARRDGFEDSPAWRQIRHDVKTRVARRVITMVRAASTSRRTLKSIASETTSLSRSLTGRETIDDASYDRLTASVDRLLGRLKPDKLTGGDPNQVGEQISKLKALKDKLVELRGRAPKGNPALEDNPSNAAGVSEEPEEDGTEDPVDEVAPNGNEDPVETWTADQLLDALRRAIAQEHGSAEAERLWAIAQSLLQSD
jgi:molecular chaperone HtpG